MALRGLKVIEMLGLAPGPFCGKILADFGATVTAIDKINPSPINVLSNGKRLISVNLKTQEGVEIVKRLCSSADILIDTFRPGVMEKLGLGPDLLLKENERLIYARLTGYGQYGSYREKAGHDINYVAMSGILSLLTRNKQAPIPPLNLIADFAGGSFSCIIGILLAIIERNTSGKGQVIDASMTEGAAYLASWIFKSRKLPIWFGEPGNNILDGGVPFYNTYKTKDEKFMAVGALEPQFYSEFLKCLQLSEDEHSQMGDLENNKRIFQEIFESKTQEEWIHIFEKSDACVTPVLELESVASHDCNKSRNTFFCDSEGTPIPEPAPRLSRTPGVLHENERIQTDSHAIEILKELGYDEESIQTLTDSGHIFSKQQSKL